MDDMTTAKVLSLEKRIRDLELRVLKTRSTGIGFSVVIFVIAALGFSWIYYGNFSLNTLSARRLTMVRENGKVYAEIYSVKDKIGDRREGVFLYGSDKNKNRISLKNTSSKWGPKSGRSRGSR